MVYIYILMEKNTAGYKSNALLEKSVDLFKIIVFQLSNHPQDMRTRILYSFVDNL